MEPILQNNYMSINKEHHEVTTSKCSFKLLPVVNGITATMNSKLLNKLIERNSKSKYKSFYHDTSDRKDQEESQACSSLGPEQPINN